MLIWPPRLPRIQAQGYTGQRRSNATAYMPELGEPLVRRRFTGRVEDIAGSVTLAPELAELLQAFFEHDLADGTLPFLCDHPVRGVAATANFLGRPPQETGRSGRLIGFGLQLLFVY